MTDATTAQLGSLLRRFRLDAALSQEELAERSTVSVRTISDLERGIRDTARLETVRLLADGLGLRDVDRAALIDAAVKGSAAGSFDPGFVVAPDPLPVPANQLLAREELVGEIVARLSGGHAGLLTLTGPGGVGKTRVAIEVATRYAQEAQRRAAFVELATIGDPALVAAAVARALNVPLTSGDAIERVGAFLSRQPMLLVLDNFEHLLGASPVVARWVEMAPETHVLVTSRARLRLSHEEEIPVPPLDLPGADVVVAQIADSGAVQLFLQRARKADSQLVVDDDTVRVAGSICQKLDGLPLAIELAASRVRVMPPATLLKFLEAQLPLLVGGNRDQPVRLQSMRGAIAWSYDLLTPDQQRLFRWLSPYLGGISLPAVEHTAAALGMGAIDAYDALDVLIDNALMQRLDEEGPNRRFRMLETVREYGIERLAAHEEEDEARLLHARFCYDWIAAEAPAFWEVVALSWKQRVQREIGNILAAFDWVSSPERAVFAVAFSEVLGPYWAAGGSYREGAGRMMRVIELASLDPSIFLNHALIWAADISLYSGDIETARVFAERSLQIARQSGNLRDLACALQSLGWVADATEQWTESADALTQSFELWKQVGERLPQGQVSMLLGGNAYVRGDYTLARRLEERAWDIFTEAGADDWLAATEWYLGFIDLAEDNVSRAAGHYFRSLELWLTDRTRTNVHKPVLHLAGIAARIGDFETAATLLGISDRLLEINGESLFPFDLPAWEEAQSSKAALGDSRFERLHANSYSLSTVEWLRLAAWVVEQTQTHTGAPSS